MATGRKGSKQSSSTTTSDSESTRGGGAGAGGATDLVAIARGLAAAVSEHGLTELIIDTPEATFTVRRGGTPVVAMPPMMAAPAPLPAAHHVAHHAPAPAAPPSVLGPPAKPAEDEKVHIVKSPFVGT